MINFFKRNLELIFWIAAIVALAATDPSVGSQYTLCPLKLIGITWCPGCGIGHAISWLLHGNLIKSWQAHWLGVPALIIISFRIYVLAAPTKLHNLYEYQKQQSVNNSPR